MIVSYYIIYTNHFDRPGVKATICKIKKFPVVTNMFVTSICPKYTIKLCQKLSRI